jgi:hypothetical protein
LAFYSLQAAIPVFFELAVQVLVVVYPVLEQVRVFHLLKLAKV